MLDIYPASSIFSEKYNIGELESSILFRLRHRNRNYSKSGASLIDLKARSVVIEKIISLHIQEVGTIIPAASLNCNIIRVMEFFKNFFYKRAPLLRRFLSRV